MSHKVIRKESDSVYDKIVYNFLKNQNGSFFLVTNDEMFVKTVRGAMRALGLSYDSLITAHISADIFKKCKDILRTYSQIVIFIESKINGRSNVFEFKQYKDAFGDKLKIVCMTPEVSEEHVSFIAENDVDSIIVKPISINNLIQKVAFSIRPSNMFQTEVDNIKMLIDQKEYESAEIKIDLLLQEKPNSPICMILKGDIARKNKDYAQAELYYQEASKGSKLNLKPLQKLAELYDEKNDIKNHIKYLLLMDKISPLNHNRKIIIGEQYSKEGEDFLAKKYYQQAIEIVKNQANDLLAATFMDIGLKLKEVNPDQCLYYMRQALDTKGANITREDLWMVNEMGMSLRKKGDWQGAVLAYQQALQLIPNEGGLHYNMGMAYAQGKEYYKAICEFERAISCSSDILQESPLIPYNIGMVYYNMNKYVEVDKYMRIALKVDPDFEHAKTMLRKITSKGD